MLKAFNTFPSSVKISSFLCSVQLLWVRSGTSMINKKMLFTNTSKKELKHFLIVSNTARNNIFLKIHLSAATKDIPEEIVEEEIMLPSIRPTDVEDHSEAFRNTLFPHSTDTIISKLKSCHSLKGLFEIYNCNSSLFTTDHCIQLLLVLWDLMRYIDKGIVGKRIYPIESLSSRRAQDQFETMPDINNLILNALEILSMNVEYLTPEVLVCSLLYTNRLGIPLKHPSNHSILVRINELLDEQMDFPLPALSRLTIILVDDDELWSKLLMVKVLPYIYKNIEKCNDLEEFRALTITMLSSIHYLKEALLLQYEILTGQFITNKIITESETSIIVKTLLLLNNIYHRPETRHLMFKLFFMLKNNIDRLFIPHLLDLQKILIMNMEPHYMISELNNFKEKYSRFMAKQLHTSVCDYNLVILPAGHEGLKILKDSINKLNRLDNLMLLHHLITTAHIDICDMFWDKVTFLLRDPEEQRNTRLIQRIAYRYLNFCNLMTLYHHRMFESQLLTLITTGLVEGTVNNNPKQLAIFATFVLAFDHRHRRLNSLSSDLVPHLIDVMSQFDSVDCMLLSRGLKQGLLHQKSKEMKLYLQLDAALSNRSREIIDLEINNSCPIDRFNIVFRTFINRKGSETDLLNSILTRTEHLNWNSLTSRSLKNLVYNLLITSSLVPAAMDRLIDYCRKNKQYITGETAGKLAYLCYYLGYSPDHSDSFWDLVADLVSRDCKLLNGLTLLQIALALSFFNKLPQKLNNFIFTVEFLENLDEEIKNCFAKDKYPLRVRKTLMELNRSVCLDHPEANVPWFHSKFCEELQAMDRLDIKLKSLMYTDVLSSLTSILGDPNYLNCKVYSPYGYSIDILINLDKALNPLKIKSSESVAYRLAILLLYSSSYTIYRKSLKGHYQMKKRHLEILGYKVLCIPASEWNSMYMAEPKAKLGYLRNLIWPPL